MAYNASVAGALSLLDAVKGFSQCPDLVQLDQDGVSDTFLDALLEDLRVGDKYIVTHNLDFVAKPLGQDLPSIPIVLG